MSNESSPTPASGDVIKETTEKVATFVKWIAELIQKRNWFTLLLLIDVVLFLTFTPGHGFVAKYLTDTVKLLELSEKNTDYFIGFWLTVGLVFVGACNLIDTVRSAILEELKPAEGQEVLWQGRNYQRRIELINC